MDPSLNLEARRLFVAAALTMRVARTVERRVLCAGSDVRDLLSLARSLDAGNIEHVHGVSFDPAYPGLTAGVETTSGGLRLLLACRAYDGRDGAPLSVVFTTLIPGRPPQVSVAPVTTPIPEGWLPPDDPSRPHGCPAPVRSPDSRGTELEHSRRYTNYCRLEFRKTRGD